MAFNSGIQSTDATWNPWHGCTKVSPGCKFCYMYRGKEQYKQDPTIVQRSKTRFNDPLKWDQGRLIFTCSWSDFFIEEADEWRTEAWQIILMTQQHFYQILTKRPERIANNLPFECGPVKPGSGIRFVPTNMILITSAEDQKTFDERWPIMKKFKTEAGLKIGLSLEPLLSPIDIRSALEDWKSQPDWVIVGGESGNDNGKWKYRPCEIEWIENVVLVCREFGIPVFVKQLGTFLAKKMGYKDRAGGDMNEWPTVEEDLYLRFREFPNFMTAIKK